MCVLTKTGKIRNVPHILNIYNSMAQKQEQLHIFFNLLSSTINQCLGVNSQTLNTRFFPFFLWNSNKINWISKKFQHFAEFRLIWPAFVGASPHHQPMFGSRLSSTKHKVFFFLFSIKFQHLQFFVWFWPAFGGAVASGWLKYTTLADYTYNILNIIVRYSDPHYKTNKKRTHHQSKLTNFQWFDIR